MIEFLGSLFSNALAVTVLVILVTSLIGFYVKMRGRDRCLRDLDGFQVTIETKDNHVAWGTLRTYATGVELLYIGADPNAEAPPLSPPRKTHGGEARETRSPARARSSSLSPARAGLSSLSPAKARSSSSSPAKAGLSSPSPARAGLSSSSPAKARLSSPSPSDRFGRPGEGRGGGQSADVYTKHSFILYNNELSRVECFYRFHDHQTDKCRHQREREIRRTYQPSLWRRFTRTMRNLFSTFKDAIVQTLNAVLGARAAATPQNPVLTKHEDLTASGAQLVESAVGSAYEPILEHYIGQYVVLEMQSQAEVEEEHGILKEYSTQYIELLNARVQVPLYIYLRQRPRVAENWVRVKQDGRVARVRHHLPHPVVVETVCSGDSERDLDLLVGPGEQIEIPLTEAEAAGPVSFAWGVRCLADLVVPRSSALVRHAGKREKLSWEAWLGLDDLPYLPWLKRLVRVRRDQPLRLMLGALDREGKPPGTGKERD